MVFVGMDLHKKTTTMVALSQDGRPVERYRVRSSAEGLRCALGDLRERSDEPISVTLEATGSWYWAVDVLEELGVDVHLANPHKVRIIAESTIKNDRVDARALAHLTRLGWLPESRITPSEVRRVRERLRYRMALVGMRTSVKCRIHALLAKRGIVPEFTDLFGKAGRDYLTLLDLPVEYRDNLDGFLRLLDFLGQEIALVERWLDGHVRANADVRLLMSIPGIGKFGAALILAEIGDIHFFRTKAKLSSFVGVVPAVRSSAGVTHLGSLKKDSNRYIRWLLSEAVTKAVRVVPSWQRLYDRVVAGNDQRRPKARMAVARKMICAVWRVLKTKQLFDPLHNCPEIETASATSSPRESGLKQGRVSD